MVMTQVPARAQRLFAIWRALPSDPLTERALEAAILKLLDRPGADADASAYRHMLTGSGAVRATRNGSGGVVYTRSKSFPEWPDNDVGPGSPSYDAHLAEIAQREQEDHDRVAAEVERNAPQNLQRAELVRLIDSRLDELKRAGDGAAVTRARELIRERSAEAQAPAPRPGRGRPAGMEAP
jgi:hypothetical protein